MFIYNVTINIEESINKQWLNWIKEHIPEVLATGKFEKAVLTKVLAQEDHGVTYSVQYYASSRDKLDAYYKEDANRLRADGLQKFGDKMLAFRTELQVIDEYSVSYN